MSGQSSIQHCPTIHFLTRLDIEPRHCHGWRRACTWRLNKEMESALQVLSSIRAEFCCMSRPWPWAPEQVLWGFEFLQCETPWPRLIMRRVYSPVVHRTAWKGGRSWRVLALWRTDRKGRLGEKSRGPGRVTRGFSRRQLDEGIGSWLFRTWGRGAKLIGGGCAAKASIPAHSSPVPLASKSHKQIPLLLYKPVSSWASY